jgi:hypothetical protein
MKQALILLALVVLLVLLTPFWLPFTDGGVRERLNENTIGLLDFGFNAVKALIVIGLVVAASFGLGHLRNRLLLIYADKLGLYPQRAPILRALPADNQPNAQIAAAFVQGNISRLPASPLRQLAPTLDADPLALPEPLPLLTASQAVDVDPVTRPHWLIVGQTGSGKSTATRFILQELTRRYACEFCICEPGGIDWNSQAAAYSETGIASAVGAVYAELERRQDLLRADDLQHVSQLGNLAYLYLVIEEMESVLDNLRDIDPQQAKDARVQLRNVARLGRKVGIGLIAVTQAARTDVFDSHVRTNLANVLLFRNSQTTAEMFRVPVRLTDLPTGTAFSVAHGRTVEFPLLARPNVPVSSIYREDALQAAEYRLEHPLTTTAATTTAGSGPSVAQTAENGSSATTSSAVAETGYTLQEIWDAYKEAKSITGAQRILYPGQQEGGSHWLEIRAAVNEVRRRRGLKSLQGEVL